MTPRSGVDLNFEDLKMDQDIFYEACVYKCNRCGAHDVAMLFDSGWLCDCCLAPMIIAENCIKKLCGVA